MKRNISDLLDDFVAESEGVEQPTPLSARRIKERTMKDIGINKPASLRWLGRVAVAVAAVMAMTLTVFAADAVLGEGKLVSKLFGMDLSDSQLEQIGDIGRVFAEVCTSNGTTVTPIMGMADEDNYYLHLRIEAPEGVILPDLNEDDGWYYDLSPNVRPYADYDLYRQEVKQMLKVEYLWKENHNQWFTMSTYASVKALTDGDPNDNVKEFVLKLSNGSDISIFNGPWQKRISFHGLYIKNRGESEFQTVLTGNFMFDIQINDENREDTTLVVDTGNLTFENRDHGYTTVLHEIRITPLAITLDFTTTEVETKYIFPKGGPVQLVMADGTVVEAMEAYEDVSHLSYRDSIVGVGETGCFDQPIVVSEIDYILINREHIIDVN